MAGGAGLFFARSEYERELISVERTVICSGMVHKDCRLVFLSDLHSHEFGEGNKRLIEAVKAASPDIILVGGDMMVSRKGVDVSISLAFIQELVKICPVYYGNGNHEIRMRQERKVYGNLYDFYVRSLRNAGVSVLGNRTGLYRDDIAITGIDLGEACYRSFKPDSLDSSYIKGLVGGPEQGRFCIMLCHSPLYYDACMDWGADLTLAGHYHGGTIRLPVLGGVMTPQYQFFLPWCEGGYHKDGKYMIVSRGLGTHSVNIRFNNAPQVVVVDLKSLQRSLSGDIYRQPGI